MTTSKFTTLEALTELLDRLGSRDIEVHLVATHGLFVAMAKRAGLVRHRQRMHVAPTLHDVSAPSGRDQPAENKPPDA